MKSKPVAVPDALRISCRVLDDKKAEDIRVLDVSGQSSITDFLLVATATSVTHLRALRVELEKALDAANTHLVGMEATEQSGWLVIDTFDVMIHLFLADTREHYGLERLWRDATELPLDKVLEVASKRRRAPRRKSTTPAKPRRAKR